MSYSKIFLAVLLPLFALFSPLAAQTTWTGSVDNDFANAANWDNGFPDNASNTGTISSGTPTHTSGNLNGLTITQTNGTFSADTTSSISFQNDSTWNLNGGTFDISNTGRFNLGAASTLNYNGGNLTSSGGGQLWLLSTDSAVNIYQNLTTDLTFAHRGGFFTVDNATLEVETFIFAQNDSVNLTLRNGATLNATTQFFYYAPINSHYGQINFTDGVNSLQAASWRRPAELDFNFTSTSVGSTIVDGDGYFTTSVWQDKWTNGELTVNGSNSGSFSDYFTVAGNTLTFSAVPEPGTVAFWVGSIALGIVVLRRRMRA